MRRIITIKKDPCLASVRGIQRLEGHHGKQSKTGFGIEGSGFKNRVLTVKLWIKTRCEGAIYRRTLSPRRRRWPTRGLRLSSPSTCSRDARHLSLLQRQSSGNISRTLRTPSAGFLMCDTFDPQNLKNLPVSAAGEKEKFDSARTTASFKAGQIASLVRVRTGKRGVRENIYSDPSFCVLAHINAGVICAFSRIRPPPSSESAFHVSILPSENVASLKQFPLSHYLMCENRLPLAGAEDTRAGHELAAKRGAGSSPNSSPPGADSPRRAGHLGLIVGPTGH